MPPVSFSKDSDTFSFFCPFLFSYTHDPSWIFGINQQFQRWNFPEFFIVMFIEESSHESPATQSWCEAVVGDQLTCQCSLQSKDIWASILFPFHLTLATCACYVTSDSSIVSHVSRGFPSQGHAKSSKLSASPKKAAQEDVDEDEDEGDEKDPKITGKLWWNVMNTIEYTVSHWTPTYLDLKIILTRLTWQDDTTVSEAATKNTSAQKESKFEAELLRRMNSKQYK